MLRMLRWKCAPIRSSCDIVGSRIDNETVGDVWGNPAFPKRYTAPTVPSHNGGGIPPT